MTTATKVEFEMHTTYHPPIGFSRRGRNEFCFVSRCGRWYARQGNFGTMILTDRMANAVHVVKGKMPEVEDKVAELSDEDRGVLRTWIKHYDSYGRLSENNDAGTVNEARQRYKQLVADKGTTFAQFGAYTIEGSIVLGEYRPEVK